MTGVVFLLFLRVAFSLLLALLCFCPRYPPLFFVNSAFAGLQHTSMLGVDTLFHLSTKSRCGPGKAGRTANKATDISFVIGVAGMG